MWKAILPGEKVAPGDTIRYQPSSSRSLIKDEIYQVVKSEVHYFEVVVKSGKEIPPASADRKVIKYMDIGYHIALELWAATAG